MYNLFIIWSQWKWKKSILSDFTSLCLPLIVQCVQSLPPASHDVLFCCREPWGHEPVSHTQIIKVCFQCHLVLWLIIDVCAFLSIRWLNKLGLASIKYEPTEQSPAVGEHLTPGTNNPVEFIRSHVQPSNSVCVSNAECYSEASDHEEAESTEIPPPPYSEQTLRDSVDTSGPPGSTHQVSCDFNWWFSLWFSWQIITTDCAATVWLSGHPSSPVLLGSPQRGQRIALVPRQHHDLAGLGLLARQAPAVLAGPGVAGFSSHRGDRRGVFSTGALASASARDGSGGGGGDPAARELVAARLSGYGLPWGKYSWGGGGGGGGTEGGFCCSERWDSTSFIW